MSPVPAKIMYIGRIPVDPSIRFWKKVDKNGPIPAHRPDLGKCWIWIGWKNEKGYGRFVPHPRKNGPCQSVFAHQFSYRETYGVIPENMEPDHLCRNPSCVNPSHLETVTHQENIRRGKHRDLCPSGHKFDEENTYVNPKGWRLCRQCHRDREKKCQLKLRLANGL